MIPRDTITIDLDVPDGDPEMLRVAARRLRQLSDHGLATAGVRGNAGAELAGVWSGPSAAEATTELAALSSRAGRVLAQVDDGGRALAAYAGSLEAAIAAARSLSAQAGRAADEHHRTLATIDITHAGDPVLQLAASTRAERLHHTELTGIHRRYGAAMDALTTSATRCARALAGLTPSVMSASPVAATPSLDPGLVYDLPLVRGQLDAAAAAGVGQRAVQPAPRDESSWFGSTLAAAGTAGAWAYNHTAVPLVNGAADVVQAAAEHPEDVAQLALGAGMMLLGAGGEVGGVALDATGVGAVAGVPIGVVAAGAIAGGATAAGAGAGNLIQHARPNENRLLHEADAPKPGRGEAGDPIPDSMRPDAAGSTWQGRVANNKNGEVWQAPDKVDPAPGKAKNADAIRIEDPDSRYEFGCVRFYNSDGQPIDLNGNPTSNAETHIRRRADGSFDLPRGWGP
ncbi:hypothetical protein BA895_07210 [Humibacillus sp. DSM 29435]|uniref:hypothetical protein n=1 Tax=Humibacillus sp. DSM 29435 TaxID=1869167 RepID=UPI0008722C2E|nr:hypothetical protein [Humibacillus sp. DSM 29435]OFE14938.1 hypothetical protein BA895_07210 [Humibacillus sp. DSM 29435]